MMAVTRTACLTALPALVDHLQQTLVPPPSLTDHEAQQALPAAVLVPLFTGADGTPHVLFTQRASTLSRHRGEISFPGGRHDPTDVSLTATALREAYEEIGLESARVTILGELPPVFTVVSNYLISPVVGQIDGTIAEIAPMINSAEVASIIEAPLAALANPAIMRTEEWLRQGVPHIVHFYQFGTHLIWGATAHMLSELLALLPPE